MSRKKAILILEDEHINRELLKIFLEEHYQLIFASELESAMNFVDDTSFDLIISDIRLGNHLDGIKMLHYSRNSKLNNSTPVLAYSASESSINQKSFDEEGFDGCISKPVKQEVILQMIREIIGS